MSAPSPPLLNNQNPQTSTARTTSAQNNANAAGGESSNDAATRLAEAIDDFLGDLEKKFRGISDEILTKLDDMAERCDRLEQEMLLRENVMEMEKTGKGEES